MAWGLFVALWPVFLMLMVAAVAIHVAQTGLVWAVEKFEFDLSRISRSGVARFWRFARWSIRQGV